MAFDDNRPIDEIIPDLPKDEQVIVKRLRAIVLDCLPLATEKNSYGVPFYAHHRIICFIWPPSVSWEPRKEGYLSKGVTLGFYHGNRMANDKGLLLTEGRKQISCMYFKSVKEIDEQEIRALLFEADMIDQQFAKKKKTKRKGA